MTETAARIAKAVLYLRKYEGEFAFLKDMQKHVSTPGATLTPRQLAAIENCIRREEKIREPRREDGFKPRGDGFKPQDLDLGVYAVARGEDDVDIYKVQFNKGKTYKYAKVLRPIGGTRLNENDERVKWEWGYVPGDINKLRPYQRMGEEEAKNFGLKYGICAACGRTLTDADSVERGIGPVCMKHFRF